MLHLRLIQVLIPSPKRQIIDDNIVTGKLMRPTVNCEICKQVNGQQGEISPWSLIENPTDRDNITANALIYYIP